MRPFEFVKDFVELFICGIFLINIFGCFRPLWAMLQINKQSFFQAILDFHMFLYQYECEENIPVLLFYPLQFLNKISETIVYHNISISQFKMTYTAKI